MNNNDLIKAISSIEKVNKNKLLKEEYFNKKNELDNEGFASYLDEEMEKLKKEKDTLKKSVDYINFLKELYTKESRNHFR